MGGAAQDGTTKARLRGLFALRGAHAFDGAGSSKVYKSKATLREGGKQREVRGYIGAPMFGRSQIWHREQ